VGAFLGGERVQVERVERTAHGLNHARGHVQVSGCGADVGVSEQMLNSAQVGAGLQHVRCAGVTEGLLILLMICSLRKSAIAFILSTAWKLN